MIRLYDGRELLFQWDINRQIEVSDPLIDEIHFSNSKAEDSLVVEVKEQGGKRLANIPNILLQEDWPIRVYGYADGQYTKQMITLKVNPRSKPADYIYTETELLDYKELAEDFYAALGDINTALGLIHEYAENVKVNGVPKGVEQQ